ncbi:uncharacterized protein LOC118184259 isoform X2 [Stegodyphus dumicola]|nr:uncharacterized protein LOC118184259 isoform X2 [Stegodyphus dumicola]XP_035209797.1 uncharacterized protein LOC118184259 isoform X2 [Stegodyphus dumicola]XP_035209798.1 uncharacterized protein LOC118184259 isoform X2 [Stegodyphus dumicola]
MDDELEEGEIADEVYPETKDKVLPRRYVLHENKSVTIKHKKTCKHVSHHHEEKHKKLKGVSLKQRNPRKKHHKTCPKRLGKLRKYLLNKIASKSKLLVPSDAETELRNDNYDLASRKKSAFKNYTSPPRKISKPQTSVANNYGPLESKFPKLISDYMKVQAGLRTLNDSLKNVSNENQLTAFDSELEGSLYIQNKSISENLPDSTTKQLNEESEDEDELRRIALASVRRAALDEFVENSVDASPSDSVKNSGMYSHDQETDNYEIVDMDVDENQDLNDDVDDQLFGIDTAPLHTEFFYVESKNPVDDQLFVIDTKPSIHNEFYNVKSESSSPNIIPHSLDKSGVSPSQLDNDFEVELLRAELIANMKSCNSGKREREEIHNVLSENSEAKSPVTTPNINFSPQAPNSLETVPETKNYTKHLKAFDLHKTVLSKAKENIPRERLIITLNNDSSSEESDQEDEDMNQKGPLQMNSAVASLEALISDARHNSDENKCNSGDKINKAVSCLSKAQQEEYNALMKILAEKEKIGVPSEQIPFKKIKAHSPLDDLKLLEKKLSIAKTNLEKEQQQLGKVVKEVTTKKSAYMKSKLTVQHLKEQLHAAEKVRISNLKLWSKSIDHFKTIKKSISKRQTLIKQLQIQCSKLGVGIQGQNYALPAVSNSNVSLKKESSS